MIRKSFNRINPSGVGSVSSDRRLEPARAIQGRPRRSEKAAADWIYAATFAATDQRALVATDAGHVIEVDPDGEPLRACHLGGIPIRIADTGDYLYVQTTTRVHYWRGGALEGAQSISSTARRP